MAGDARTPHPTGDVVPEASTDLDTIAPNRPVARSVPEEVTRRKTFEAADIQPNPVPNPQVATDATLTVQAEAPVAPPSVRGVGAERPSPPVSPVKEPAVQPPTAEAESFGATAPQFRRFIKSRTYVPMHELRRRFGIEGGDDDVTGVDVDREHRVFVGLPTREGRLLGELFRAGDVGYELSLDPISPIVVGVFPMRPVARG